MIRRRLFWALIASVTIHLCVLYWFRQTHLAAQFNAQTDRLVPRIFNVKRLAISDSALQNSDKVQAQNTPAPKPALKPLDIPDDKPLADVTSGRLAPTPAPAVADMVKPIATDKPLANVDTVQEIARVDQNASHAMEQDLASLKDSLLKDQPANAPHAALKLPDSSNLSAAQNDAQGMAQASGRLDTLLGHGLHSGDAPVTLPGGAVFEFGSADLKDAAIAQLRKLGELIKRNPDVTFSIGGYTDSFGDAQYNLDLSQQRADSVRTWLIQNMDVDPTHIQATGYGATKFLVQPKPVDMHSQASIDQEKDLEASNRRVEIKFNFPKAK